MKRNLRDRIVELLGSVAEGLKDTKKLGVDDAYVVLNDCSTALESVQKAVEREISGGRFPAYEALLRETQDMLQAIYDQKVQGVPEGPSVKDARKLVNELRRELEKDPEVKTSVVFLPYKAAMWDSMDSIWRAAKADERCEVAVVPVPYHEKNPDGTLGEQFDDGPLFPAELEVKSWKAYSLEAEQPDIAYIHNPYDDRNYVTSVAPAFYSAELKKHVRTLAYVPYYVSENASEGGPGEAALGLHADILVAQSEEDRQFFKKAGFAGDVAALGSAKTDRVLALDREKPDMPPAWRPLLEGKKVFLLNTTVADFLAFSGTILEKLRLIFRYFSQQDDAALLWRPHPLTKSTLASMRPGMLDAYCEMELFFRQAQTGVLDDSDDVERAIALSDAYIGSNSSSLAFMFGITGKPVYLYERTIERAAADDAALREELSLPPVSSPVVCGDTLWFAGHNINALCKVPLAGGRAEVVARFPGEEPYAQGFFGAAVELGGKLCFAPLNAAAFAMYDPETAVFGKAQLAGQYRTQNTFYGAVAHKDRVVCVPFMGNAIAVWQPSTGKVRYYDDWRKQAEPYIKDRRNWMFPRTSCVCGSKLYLPFVQDDIVVEFDMDTGAARLHPVAAGGTGYNGIAFDGKAFWLVQNRQSYAPRTAPEAIVKWEPESGAVTQYADFPDGFLGGDHFGPPVDTTSFSAIFACDGKLLALPCYANMVVEIDPASGSMRKFDTGLPRDIKEGEQSPATCAVVYLGDLEDGNILLYWSYGPSLLKLDTRGKTFLQFDMHFEPDAELAQELRSAARFRRENYYEEINVFPVGSFVEQVLSGEIPAEDARQAAELRAKVVNGDGTSGRKTHEYVYRRAEKAPAPKGAED